MCVFGRRASAVLLSLAVVAAAGCGNDGPSRPSLGGTRAPDFAVRDVNPNSPRNGELVSPRDYLGEVSAWYFGHAT